MVLDFWIIHHNQNIFCLLDITQQGKNLLFCSHAGYRRPFNLSAQVQLCFKHLLTGSLAKKFITAQHKP
jgi:hypothetical protein